MVMIETLRQPCVGRTASPAIAVLPLLPLDLHLIDPIEHLIYGLEKFCVRDISIFPKGRIDRIFVQYVEGLIKAARKLLPDAFLLFKRSPSGASHNLANVSGRTAPLGSARMRLNCRPVPESGGTSRAVFHIGRRLTLRALCH